MQSAPASSPQKSLKAPARSRMSWSCFRLSFCSSTINFPSVSSYEAADLALAFIDPLHPLLASLLSRAQPSPPSGVALLDTVNPPIAGVHKPLRAGVVRTRVQLKLFEILGLLFAQTTMQFFWDERMMPSGDIDVTFSFCFSCVVHKSLLTNRDLHHGHSFVDTPTQLISVLPQETLA